MATDGEYVDENYFQVAANVLNRLIILIPVIPTCHVFTSIRIVSDVVGPESEMCCDVQEVQQDHEGGDEQNENVDDEVFDQREVGPGAP